MLVGGVGGGRKRAPYGKNFGRMYVSSCAAVRRDIAALREGRQPHAGYLQSSLSRGGALPPRKTRRREWDLSRPHSRTHTPAHPQEWADSSALPCSRRRSYVLRHTTPHNPPSSSLTLSTGHNFQHGMCRCMVQIRAIVAPGT